MNRIWPGIIFVVIGGLWTLLARGSIKILAWMPALADVVINSTGLPDLQGYPPLNQLPPPLIESWLPQLQQLSRWLVPYFPGLVEWGNYAIGFLWAVGIIIILLAAIIMRRFTTDIK
ncbi:hypothetical protein J1J25_004598 [Salmonella enterica subsp. diarizonae serovar 53:r:z35]|nr:hypothetical protein [Salmonella enterica subsp. arizonae]EHG2955335.1 hypothetical protein [Salmonella enterica subsp. diarizonae serovar 53:r:z35]